MTEDLLQRVDAPPVERDLAFDMAKRGLIAAPFVIALASAIWGVNGGISAAFSMTLALANLIVSAAMISWAARISLIAMATAALGGYIVRLAVITGVVLAVQNQSWVSWIPLALTLGFTQLVLLIWETRHVSATLAYPSLKPRSQKGR